MGIIHDPERGVLALEVGSYEDIEEIEAFMIDHPELSKPVTTALTRDAMDLLRQLGTIFVVHQVLTLTDGQDPDETEIDAMFVDWTATLVAAHLERLRGARARDERKATQKKDTPST